MTFEITCPLCGKKFRYAADHVQRHGPDFADSTLDVHAPCCGWAAGHFSVRDATLIEEVSND